MGHVEGVGTTVLYKLDQQLLSRSTSGARKMDIDECQFAESLEAVLKSFKEYGLTIKTSKCHFFESSVEYLGKS